MKNCLSRPGTIGALGLSTLLGGGCVAPPPAPIELTVTVRESGICCVAGNLVSCHDRTADIKAAYADPDRLHHTVPMLGFTDFDLPGTVERDLARTVEHDLGGTVERDLARTVEHDRGDTVEHDLLRCKFRNKQLLGALRRCHKLRNLCLSNNLPTCDDEYQACYIQAVQAGPFD
jgi:hypothetical protein